MSACLKPASPDLCMKRRTLGIDMDASEAAEALSPRELLFYNDTYRVVICTACEYAVQPNAIARHLKEIHAIYRHHRRPYIDHVARLPLSDPSEVLGAIVGEFPVSGLPTISGLQCLSPSCGHLCATVKRMQSHWLASHGTPGCAALDWQSVPLQTFFRGNMLRYFTHPALSLGRSPTESQVCMAQVPDSRPMSS